jgi:ATP-dependent Clp protease ATP-binding subunit ClpX
MSAARLTPRAIVAALDQYVIGQDEAKRIVAVAVYAHFRKVEQARAGNLPIAKSNLLLIGPSGTGKTLLCETLSKILEVPFATAEATSLAQARFVNDEIEAILQRLVDKAGGDMAKAARGIVFIDEIDKLKAPAGQARSVSGESVQHALLKIMEGSQVKLGSAGFLDTTDILFICGGAFVGLDEIRSLSHHYGFIATTSGENQKILDRLNARVKPTDLFTFGLIPEFTGRLPIIARFSELTRDMLVRIMTEPRDAIYAQFRAIFANEGVELRVERKVFEQIADLAIEYKTGARSLRGLFEELITPVLYVVPDDRSIERVEIASLFAEPVLIRNQNSDDRGRRLAGAN